MPPLALCGDNAAMIAWAGAERLGAGLAGGAQPPAGAAGGPGMMQSARARWPLGIAGQGAANRGNARMSRIAIIGAGAWGTALGDDGAPDRR